MYKRCLYEFMHVLLDVFLWAIRTISSSVQTPKVHQSIKSNCASVHQFMRCRKVHQAQTWQKQKVSSRKPRLPTCLLASCNLPPCRTRPNVGMRIPAGIHSTMRAWHPYHYIPRQIGRLPVQPEPARLTFVTDAAGWQDSEAVCQTGFTLTGYFSRTPYGVQVKRCRRRVSAGWTGVDF